MKLFCVLFLFISILLLTACSGGKPLKEVPDQIKIGAKELKSGGYLYNRGCYNRALKHFFRAHEQYVATDQQKGTAMCLNNIGNIYRLKNDIEGAQLFYKETIQIYSAIGDHQGAVQALSNNAAAVIDSGKFEDAGKILDVVEALAQKNNITFIPMLKNRGILYIKENKLKEAQIVLEKALSRADPENNTETATVNYALGNLMIAKKAYGKAVGFFGRALVADKKTEFYQGIADDLAALANAHHFLGDMGRAVDFYQRAIKIYAFLGNKDKALDLMEKMETSAQKSGADTTITKHFTEAWLKGETLSSPCE